MTKNSVILTKELKFIIERTKNYSDKALVYRFGEYFVEQIHPDVSKLGQITLQEGRLTYNLILEAYKRANLKLFWEFDQHFYYQVFISLINVWTASFTTKNHYWNYYLKQIGGHNFYNSYEISLNKTLSFVISHYGLEDDSSSQLFVDKLYKQLITDSNSSQNFTSTQLKKCEDIKFESPDTPKKLILNQAKKNSTSNINKCPDCQAKLIKRTLKAHLRVCPKKTQINSNKNNNFDKQKKKIKKGSSKFDSIENKNISIYDKNENMDGGKNVGYLRRENGRFGSMPIYDDYSENSWS